MKLNLWDRLTIVGMSSLLLGLFNGDLAFAQAGNEILVFPENESAEDRGNTGNTENPGVRPPSTVESLCQNPEGNLKALVPVQVDDDPNTQFSVERIWGAYTLEEMPTLWFYVPYSESLTAKLTLANENGIEIAQTRVTLPGRPGLVAITLPAIPEVEQQYRWTFSLICNPQIPARNITVSGGIERLEAEESLSLARLTNLGASYWAVRPQIFELANRQIWYDTLTAVGTRYYADVDVDTDRQQLEADWQSLLESVDLEAYSQFPIVFVHSSD